MKYFWKINIYEIQALLYWILGNLLIHFGNSFFGWIAIGWGWLTIVYTFWFTVKNVNELKDLFD